MIFLKNNEFYQKIQNIRIKSEKCISQIQTLLEIDFLGIVDSTKSAKLVKKTIVRVPKKMQGFKNVIQSFSEGVMEDEGLFELLKGNIAYQTVYNDLCEGI